MLYESLGAKLIYMSFFVSLARAVEILLKPIVAHFSDNLVSRFGRRKPFMFIGCFFYMGFLLLVFTPPFLTQTAEYISMWFGVFYVLFFIADTIVNVPYLALGPELSKKPKERERMYVWYYLFQYIGVLVTAISPIILAEFLKPDCDCTQCYNSQDLINSIQLCIDKCNLFCSLQSNLVSLKILAYIIGVEFVITITLLCIFVPEKNSNQGIERNNSVNSNLNDYSNDSNISESPDNAESGSLIPKLYQMVHNKPFLKLVVPWIIDITVVTIFSTMMPFFMNVVINPQKYCKENGIELNSLTCNPSIWLGICISAFFISCMLAMTAWHWLVIQIGKKECWKLYSVISVFTFAGFSLCGFGDMEKAVMVSIFCAIPAGGGYLNDVHMSDVIDYDEYVTGKRNEGLYTVFITFIPKFVSILSQSVPISILACKRIK